LACDVVQSAINLIDLDTIAELDELVTRLSASAIGTKVSVWRKAHESAPHARYLGLADTIVRFPASARDANLAISMEAKD